MQILLNLLPSLPEYRLANRALKAYLASQGLFGARFGYLGGFHLTLTLARVALSLPTDAQAHHLVHQFFETYSNWDWKSDDLYPVPSSIIPHIPYKRAQVKEPMVILSIVKPQVNLTFNASQHSLEVLTRHFKKAKQALEDPSVSWPRVCGTESGNLPLKTFIDSSKAFVRFNFSHWGGNCVRGREVLGWAESKIVLVS